MQQRLPRGGERVKHVAPGIGHAGRGQPLDVPLDHQRLVHQVPGGEGVLQEMVGVARPGPRPQPQRRSLRTSLGCRSRDQLAGGQVEGAPAVPGERGEVTGVAREHRGVPLGGREAVPPAELADRRDLGRLGQRAEQRVAQRPRQQPRQRNRHRAPAAADPGRPGKLAHAPAADRLDQRPDERQRGGLDLFRPPQVVGEHVQLPEGHHQAAAAQPHQVKPRVRGARPFRARPPRRPPELRQQVAVAGHGPRLPVGGGPDLLRV